MSSLMDSLLEVIGAKFPLESLDVGEFGALKVSGMKFTLSAYKANGLGHVSCMSAKGFFGLMKMDTLIIVPQDKDLPLYSYDRIQAMGNDTLYLELYNTVVGSFDGSSFDALKKKFTSLPDFDPGKHWYDDIKLSQSIFKKAKKAQGPAFDEIALDYMKAFVASGADGAGADGAGVGANGAGAGFDMQEKLKKSQAYVNGLITNGGPSTDVFKKALGEEKTSKLFKTVLFGV